jgi:hypothetical protein
MIMKLAAALVAGAVALGVAGDALAQVEVYDWKQIGSGNGVTVSYNAVSVSGRGTGTVQATLKVVYSPAQPYAGMTVGSTVNRITINCQAGTFTQQSRVYYDASGAALAPQAPIVGAVPLHEAVYGSVAQQEFCS